MAVPEFNRFIRPALEAVAAKDGIHRSEVAEQVAHALRLSDTDRGETIPGSSMTRLEDRTGWALTYLRAARLIEKVGRGTSRITDRGRAYLERAPEIIRPQDLSEFPEFSEFYRGKGGRGRSKSPLMLIEPASITPQEALQQAYDQLRDALAADVLDSLKHVPPSRFERLIIDLMLRLGYGSAIEDAGMALGKSGDEGVDGVIKQDRLGLDNIYLQAKRWDSNTVGRKDIQAFVGALSGKGASKGVFITTSVFSREARDFASSLQTPRLSLIDGLELARLMIDYDLGVTLEQRFDVKRIDSDYFAEN